MRILFYYHSKALNEHSLIHIHLPESLTYLFIKLFITNVFFPFFRYDYETKQNKTKQNKTRQKDYE